MTSQQHLSASMRRATVFSFRRNEKLPPWNFFQCAALFTDENLRGKNIFLQYFSTNNLLEFTLFFLNCFVLHVFIVNLSNRH